MGGGVGEEVRRAWIHFAVARNFARRSLSASGVEEGEKERIESVRKRMSSRIPAAAGEMASVSAESTKRRDERRSGESMATGYVVNVGMGEVSSYRNKGHSKVQAT